MSHTPGPWKVVKALTEVRHAPGGVLCGCEDDCIVDQNNVEVLGCSEWLRCKPGDMKLIAAAPCLLEACKRVWDEWQHTNNATDMGSDGYATLQVIREAIAKAEGES